MNACTLSTHILVGCAIASQWLAIWMVLDSQREVARLKKLLQERKRI